MTAHDKLIAGLPTDVPETLCHLLLWLDVTDEPTVDDPTPSLLALAKILHDSERTVRRAIDFGVASGILDISDVFNQAGKIIRVPRHTKQETESEGKRIGRLITPNWIKITGLQNISMVTLDTLNGNQCGHSGQTGRVPSRRQERIGEEGVLGTLTVTPVSDAIAVLAWQQLTKRYREAQQERGIPEHRQTDLVHGRKDTWTLKDMIQRMEPNGIWAPYMRVVNLFSFWIEHHPLKNLKTAMGSFRGNSPEWIQALNEWEETATQEFRVLTATPETPSKVLPVPVASVDSKPIKPADDPRVCELIQHAYDETGVAPDIKKAAILIATYGIEYVQGAMSYGLDGIHTIDAVPANASEAVYDKALAKDKAEKGKFIKTLFSESGGLAIIAAYRDMVLDAAVDWLIRSGGGNEDAAKNFCRKTLSASQVISIYELKSSQQPIARYRSVEAARPTQKELSQQRTKWVSDLNAWTQDVVSTDTIDDFLVKNPKPASLLDDSLIIDAQESRKRLLAGEKI
jgi:hypothetical protein